MDPELFAGRTVQIKEVAQALHTKGQCLVIYGDRGIGKTSLAFQASQMAMGSTALLRMHALTDWAIPFDRPFIPFYIPCSDATPDMGSVFDRISREISRYIQSLDRPVDRTVVQKLSVKFYERAVSETLSSDRRIGVDNPLESSRVALEDKLYYQIRELKSIAHDAPILIILDEVDKVQDLKGLASFLRSFSNDVAKFVLVGRADDVSRLLDDHRSVERVIAPVGLPRMRIPELVKIFDKAMLSLHEQRLMFEFTENFKVELAEISGGFPWFVHVIGQEALIRAYEDRRLVIDSDDLAPAMRSLTSGRFSTQFGDRYNKAISNSMEREYVLRCFAHHPSSYVPIYDVYARLYELFGVRDPAGIVSDLTTDRYGSIFLDPPDNSDTHVRFADEMFRRFALWIPSKFPNIKEDVEAIFERPIAERPPSF